MPQIWGTPGSAGLYKPSIIATDSLGNFSDPVELDIQVNVPGGGTTAVMFPLPILVELLIAGTWTDVSGFVYQRDGIHVTGGKSARSEKASPATCTITFNNRDGRFSPRFANGAYFPYLQQNTQIRVSLNNATSSSGTTYSGYRFWGEVAEWPPASDVSGHDVYVSVTASGPLRRINQGGGEGSALQRYYASLPGPDVAGGFGLAPIAYWPCEEDPDTSQIGSGIQGDPQFGFGMTVTGTPKWKAVSDFNGSAPIALLNGSKWDGRTGQFGGSGDDLYTVPGTYTWIASTSTVDVRLTGAGGGGGGFPGSPGAAGQDTTFTAGTVTVTGHGGKGGSAGGSGTGGAGGTGYSSPTALHFSGGAGGTGSATAGGGGGGSGGTSAAGNPGSAPSIGGGAGGAAVAGGGAGGRGGGAGLTGSNGQAGTAPGGASGGTGNAGGGGGGGGEFAREPALAVTPGNPYTITVGAGGRNGGPGGAGGSGGQAELLYTPPPAPPANVTRFIMVAPAWGGNDQAVLLRVLSGGTIARLDCQYRAGGNLRMLGYASGGANLFDSGNLSVNANGQTLMVSMELTPSGANVAWSLSAIIPGQPGVTGRIAGTLSSAVLGNVSEVIAAPNQDVTKTAMGHISVQYTVIPLWKVSQALNGHEFEGSADRFIRLANEEALGNLVEYSEGADHWGFEAGIQGWTAANGTLVTSTFSYANDFTDRWPPDGSQSLLLTANGSGQPSASGPAGLSGQPVQPGDVASLSIDLYAPAQLSHVYVGLKWYDISGNFISESDTADAVLAAGQPTPFRLSGKNAVAPSLAAGGAGDAQFCVPVFGDHNTDPNGTLLYADNVRLSPHMGVQTRKAYHDFLQEIEDLDQGILKEAKELFGMKLRTRIRVINQDPALNLDYSQGMLSPPLQPVIDTQNVRNNIIVQRHKGSKVEVKLDDGQMSVQQPPAGVGIYKKFWKTVAAADEQLAAVASHLLNIGTAHDERYPTVTVDLTRASLPGSALAPLMAAVAGVEIGDMIELDNLPFWYPSTTSQQLVLGYDEVINSHEWTITWNCATYSPFIQVTSSGSNPSVPVFHRW